jgi:DNA repair protein RecO (recombination protein O)
MSLYKTRGIVIGRYEFGEADKIIVLLTPDKGVLRCVAKGVRRIKSRMAGHLELFTETELMLATGKNMDVITSARMVSRPDVTSNYDQMKIAYLIGEMVNRLGSDGDHPGLFELVHKSLTSLDRPDEVLEFWFKLNLLDVLGYRPGLKGCMKCHQNSEAQPYRFNDSLGGIVCSSCGLNSGTPISIDQIKFWRLALTQDIEKARSVINSKELAKDSLKICNQFYEYTFGKKFRSEQALT